ncbi:phosphotransferase family protein [Ornithinibacillus californiensis]|uniref:phosphotransferase family protein n=1 Tax=Ornithinibacillus californiensis TaxID=161536 RepID=UPI0009FF2218|nr:phosphotransferase family protein [Ornithinibacillus californiensis]
MEWFQRVLGDEWEITPAGGLTGEAYFAKKESKQLFLKRNSSPFLAVLSAEGIVPKLVWTKRLNNGDVITAQKWLKGRELRPAEMQNQCVADLLHKIHHSTELLHMLLRLGKKPITADDYFLSIQSRLQENRIQNSSIEIKDALIYLENYLPIARQERQTVCHGDMNHHNLLLTEAEQLFLIDWDNAMIADPIADYGKVLNSYIPKENWKEWLKQYGIELDKPFLIRMYWYLIIDSLSFLAFHFERQELDKYNELLISLKELNFQMRLL